MHLEHPPFLTVDKPHNNVILLWRHVRIQSKKLNTQLVTSACEHQVKLVSYDVCGIRFIIGSASGRAVSDSNHNEPLFSCKQQVNIAVMWQKQHSCCVRRTGCVQVEYWSCNTPIPLILTMFLKCRLRLGWQVQCTTQIGYMYYIRLCTLQYLMVSISKTKLEN